MIFREIATSDLYLAAFVLAAVEESELVSTTLDPVTKVMVFGLRGAWGESNLSHIYASGGYVDAFQFTKNIRRLKRLACEGRPKR